MHIFYVDLFRGSKQIYKETSINDAYSRYKFLKSKYETSSNLEMITLEYVDNTNTRCLEWFDEIDNFFVKRLPYING